jgi:hypothetical protein
MVGMIVAQDGALDGSWFYPFDGAPSFFSSTSHWTRPIRTGPSSG